MKLRPGRPGVFEYTVGERRVGIMHPDGEIEWLPKGFELPVEKDAPTMTVTAVDYAAGIITVSAGSK